MADADTLHYQLKTQTAAVIVALNLTSDDPLFAVGSNVVVQMWPDQSNYLAPGVIVTNVFDGEAQGDGTTLHSDRWYPVRVLIADRETERYHQREPVYLKWRKAINDAFHQQRPVTIAGLKYQPWCEVEPERVIDPEKQALQFIVSSLILRYFVREPRTGRLP